MFTNTLALAALAVSPALAQYGVNIYWGQTGGETLQSVCQKDGFEYVTLGFINQSPAQDPSGLNYPGSDFSANCGSACFGITGGIATCKVNQKKVLLSIGGVFAADSDYTVSTVQEGEQFADFLWAAYGPLADGYTGPRPFADNVVDGFDLDIETKFADQSGYVALVNRLRQHITDAGSSAIITAAPQCPLDPAWFDMETILTQARFDLLFVQFYNNPVCDYVVGNANPESFNFLAWQSFIAGTANAGAKLLVGLPGDATPNSAGSGYVAPAAAAQLMQDLKAQPSFGGAMVWDANTGGANVLANGRNYYQNLHDALAIPNPAP
ncbi:glycoside hydrolase superfamily, partial [Coniochaeta sp. 2T2.1]